MKARADESLYVGDMYSVDYVVPTMREWKRSCSMWPAHRATVGRRAWNRWNSLKPGWPKPGRA